MYNNVCGSLVHSKSMEEINLVPLLEITSGFTNKIFPYCLLSIYISESSLLK